MLPLLQLQRKFANNKALKVSIKDWTPLFLDKPHTQPLDLESTNHCLITSRKRTEVQKRNDIIVNLLGDLTGLEKVGSSLTAGFLGALIGNPADLALVRFQSDGSLPVDQRRNYRHVFDAFSRIIKEEGLLTLWRGSAPTVIRGMAMNLGMVRKMIDPY